LGTAAFAIADGTVVLTGVIHGYGNVLLLEFTFNGRPLYALYAHLLHALVHAGQNGNVTEGQKIALTGKTGNAGREPPHLHFEIWTHRAVGRYPEGRISPGDVLGYHFDNMDNRMLYRNMG
jgi:murein DD-endopeptidase MepM/ murein hydrolase activator NlpD